MLVGRRCRVGVEGKVRFRCLCWECGKGKFECEIGEGGEVLRGWGLVGYGSGIPRLLRDYGAVWARGRLGWCLAMAGEKTFVV